MIPPADQASFVSLGWVETSSQKEEDEEVEEEKEEEEDQEEGEKEECQAFEYLRVLSSRCDARRAPANSRHRLTLPDAACEGSDWPNQLIPQLLILLEGPA